METKDDLESYLVMGLLITFSAGVLLMFGVFEIYNQLIPGIILILLAIGEIILVYHYAKKLWNYILETKPPVSTGGIDEDSEGLGNGFSGSEESTRR